MTVEMGLVFYACSLLASYKTFREMALVHAVVYFSVEIPFLLCGGYNYTSGKWSSCS